MVNLNGELIGINTAIATGGYERSNRGVGFAIPANMVNKVKNDLINNGYVVRPIYSSVRAEHAERQVIPQIKRLYKPDDRYEFRYDTVEDILNNVKLSGYTRKMARML